MPDYFVRRHAELLSRAKDRGLAVTFTKTTPGEPDPATNRPGAPVTTEVTGYAVQAPGNPEEYAALSLMLTKADTMVFVPNTIDTAPVVDSVVTWAGSVRTVRSVVPVHPNGTGIGYRVIVE